MLIALWIILKVTFLACGIFLIYALIQTFLQEDKETFVEGFRNALADCGFFLKKGGYSVELYKWVANDNEEICEESLERTQWPAMDIADWMKAGLPCSAEGESLCGQDCSCKLVLYKRARVSSSSK